MSSDDDLCIIECPCCDSGQRFASMRDYYEGRGYRCNVCNGTGEIEDECPLITLDELEEISHEALADSSSTVGTKP